MTRRHHALLAIALSACGCAADLGHDPTSDADAYRRVLDGPGTSEDATADATADAAREAGDGAGGVDASAPLSLSLSRAQALCVRRNETLAIHGEEYVRALVERDRRAATLLPTVSLVPAFLRQKSSAVAPPEFVPDRAVDVSVIGEYDVDIPAQLEAVDAATGDAEARRGLLRDVECSVLLDVGRTFYGILRAEAATAYLERSVDVATRRLADLRVDLRAGAATDREVAGAAALLAAARSSLLEARRVATERHSSLAVLLAVPSVPESLDDDLGVPESDPDEDALVDRAWSHRGDLLAARAMVRARAAGVRSAWDERYPSLGLDLSGFLTRETFPSDVTWTGVVRLTFPVFDPARIDADLRDAWSRFRESRTAAALAERRVRHEIHVALADLRARREQVRAAMSAVAAAEEEARVVHSAAANGAATGLDEAEAEEHRLRARLGAGGAGLDLKLAWLTVLRAEGRMPPGVPDGELPAQDTRPGKDAH